MLFAIEYNITRTFPAMHPLMIDDMPFVDVIKLFGKIRKMQIREEEMNDPDRVIRVEAGDKWF